MLQQQNSVNMQVDFESFGGQRIENFSFAPNNVMVHDEIVPHTS